MDGQVTAVGRATLLRLERREMSRLLGDLPALLARNAQEQLLRSVALFKDLTATEISIFAEALAPACFEAGARIVKHGAAADTFYIVASGRVEMRGPRMACLAEEEEQEEAQERAQVAVLGESACFGELALLHPEPPAMSVVAVEPTVCMCIDRATFGRVVGSLEEILAREAKQRAREERRGTARHLRSQYEEIGLLGIGTFGRVTLVKHLPSGGHYALKAMRKRQLIKLKQVDHVLSEQSTLARCDHPFLLRLAATFQDELEVFLVTDLALGGELFQLLVERNSFDEGAACFYAANVALALAHLHDRRIVREHALRVARQRGPCTRTGCERVGPAVVEQTGSE